MRPQGCSAQQLMAHFRISHDDMHPRTVERKMKLMLGPGGGSFRRRNTVAGALIRGDRQQRRAWSVRKRYPHKVIMRADAMSIAFPERAAGGPRRSPRVWRRRGETWRPWACKTARTNYHVPKVWVITGLFRTRVRSHGLWGATCRAQVSDTHKACDVTHFMRTVAVPQLKADGHLGPNSDRVKLIPAEFDGGKPFQAEESRLCYDRNGIVQEPLPPRSGDVAPIEHLNALIKKRVNNDLALRFPTGLVRNRDNLRRFKTFVKRSLAKHTRKNQELSQKLKNIVNSVPSRNRRLLDRNGGPIC